MITSGAFRHHRHRALAWDIPARDPAEVAGSDDVPDHPRSNTTVPRIEPFLITYGSGPKAEDVARRIAADCAAHAVHADVYPIDEIAQAILVFYLALIAVLPSAPTTDIAKTLQPFKRLIGDYRARRPHGLKALHQGYCQWFTIGVVQVCGLRGIMHHPQTKALLTAAEVCATHYIDDFAPAVDVFTPYDSEVPTHPDQEPDPDDDAYHKTIQDAWNAIQKWGVTDIQQVPSLRKCIEQCRHHYETNRFSALYRPNPQTPNSNMLDLILNGPHQTVGDRTAWLENAARVCRYVKQQLQRHVPELEYPTTRGVQEQLRQLYQNLRITEKAMGDPGDTGLPG